MTYEVQVKDLPAQHVVSAHIHTPFAQLGSTFAEEVGRILGHVSPLGGWAVGAPFAIYYNQPFSPGDVDVEIAVPVSAGVAVNEEELRTKDLPPARAACTVHSGSYGAIGEAYKEIFDWLAKAGRSAAGPPREVYLVGPAQTDRPAEYLTEIEVPIR